MSAVVSFPVPVPALPSLGASSAAAACGLSPWRTPFQLYQKLLGILPPDDDGEEDEEALQLEMGLALEPITIRRFERRTKIKVTDTQLRVVDPAWDRRHVTVDGMCSDGGYLEAKTTGYLTGWGDESEDDAVPRHYYLQVQHGLACTGRPHAWVPMYYVNREFRVYRVLRNDAVIARMTEIERAFLARVDTRNPPPPSTLEDVRQRYPKDTGKPIEATEAIRALVEAHAAQREAEKQAKAAKDAALLEVAAFMGDASLLTFGGETLVTYKRSRDGKEFDETRFALDHPALYATYSTKTRAGSRRFLNKL